MKKIFLLIREYTENRECENNVVLINNEVGIDKN